MWREYALCGPRHFCIPRRLEMGPAASPGSSDFGPEWRNHLLHQPYLYLHTRTRAQATLQCSRSNSQSQLQPSAHQWVTHKQRGELHKCQHKFYQCHIVHSNRGVLTTVFLLGLKLTWMRQKLTEKGKDKVNNLVVSWGEVSYRVIYSKLQVQMWNAEATVKWTTSMYRLLEIQVFSCLSHTPFWLVLVWFWFNGQEIDLWLEYRLS